MIMMEKQTFPECDGFSFSVPGFGAYHTNGECLAMLVARKIKKQDVIDILFHLYIFRGIPEHIRSDNGPEFSAGAVRKWLMQPGSHSMASCGMSF